MLTDLSVIQILLANLALLAGAASTYMGTITAVGGPPIALIYQNQKGPLVRANMSAFFLVASFFSLTALVTAGYLGRGSCSSLP
jgi:uncharacterized protein